MGSGLGSGSAKEVVERMRRDKVTSDCGRAVISHDR
jgi:hypothetical protein